MDVSISLGRVLGILWGLLSLTGCDDDVRRHHQDTSYLFNPNITHMVIEVDYQQNAEPYTELQGTDASPWDFFATNVEKLFAPVPRSIEIPTTLSAMENIGNAPLKNYTADDLLELSSAHRDVLPTQELPSFHVLFVNGYYYEDEEQKREVLGLSIGDTSTVVMFKPVIKRTAPDIPGPTDDLIRTFAEQTTVIHEFGHAIGLVNNGLPLTSEHHDTDHGRHCTNKKCVMYYMNEGARDLVQFAKDLDACLARAQTPEQATDCRVVYGQECLDDAYQAAQAETESP